LAVIS